MPTGRSSRNVDLHVRKGEVVGIAGLMGAGRTEFAMSVFGRSYGQRHQRRGAAARQARSTPPPSARRSAAGIAYATEDRKTYGLNLIDHIKHNITIANLKGVVEARRASTTCAS